MSVVRYIKYENSLAKLIKMPGGKTIAAAVADAEVGLQSIQGECLAQIDRLILTLTEVSAQFDAQSIEPLYAASREIAGLAATCQLTHLGEAALSLCVLVDNSRTAPKWLQEAVRVHISTLQLLRGPASGAEDAVQRQLVDSLEDMVRRLYRDDLK